MVLKLQSKLISTSTKSLTYKTDSMAELKTIHSCHGISLPSFVRTYEIFENNIGNDHKFHNNSNESLCKGSDTQFSFKYYPKMEANLF